LGRKPNEHGRKLASKIGSSTSLAMLAEETLEADQAQTATGLPPAAFATLWYFRGKGLPEETADTVARAAAQAFEESPQWRARSDQERLVRMKLHAALIKAGQKEGTGTYVEDIISSLRRTRA
jgi:hypothetical protein